MHKLALIAFVISACGPDNSSGSIPIDGLGNAVVDAYCGIEVGCGLIPDLDTCRALSVNTFTVDSDLVAAVLAGKIIYHGDKARECIDAVYGTTCDRSMLFRAQPLACDQAFVGTVGDGGACALRQECISQDCNIPSCSTNTCCMGTCVGSAPPSRADLGQTCSSTIRCNTGYCDATSSLCVAYLPDGASCMSSSSCASDSCATTCQALIATNGTCTTSSQCQLLGDTCNSTSKTCVPYAPLGAACMTSGDCGTLFQCDATQHCAARPRLGDTCTGTGSCVDASYCDTTAMKCTALKVDGTACTSQSECQSKSCDTTTTHSCVTPPVCI